MKEILSKEELLDWISRILNENKEEKLSSTLLIRNGFPRNAILRRLGGIQQIASDLGIENPYNYTTIKGRKLERIASSDVEEFLNTLKGKTLKLSEYEILLKNRFGFKPSIKREVLRRFNVHLLSSEGIPLRGETEEYLINSIKKVGEINSGIRPNKKLYEEIRKRNNLKIATARSICRHFKGSQGWFEACKLAGFDIEQDLSMQSRWLSFFERVTSIKLEREKSFDSCRNPRTGRKLYFDGFNEEKKLLVEFQDRSHFERLQYYTGDDGLEERIFKDDFKKTWAKENGYVLLQYPYTEGFNKQSIITYLTNLKII